MSAHWTTDYISALFEPHEHVALLAVPRVDDPSAHVHQRIAQADAVISPKYQAWLRHLNANGHDIFLGTNPFNPDRQRREKQDVLEIRRLQLDLDTNGPDSLVRVLADVGANALPKPAAVITSSQHNYQVLWHTLPSAWSPDEAEDIMGRLADRFDGDHSVADIARVMRLPGFRNKKRRRGDYPVSWTAYDATPVAPADFAHLPPGDRPTVTRARRHGQPRNNGITQSERDWAFVRDRLRRGADADALCLTLEQQRRSDKHNPADYAARTVRKALQSLQPDS